MRADAAANRAAILDAATALFAEFGAEVPMAAVAKTAKVGPATLYRNFANPQKLAIGVMGNLRDRVQAICDRWRTELQAGKQDAWLGLVGDLVDVQLGPLLVAVVPLVDDQDYLTYVEPLRDSAHGAINALLDEAKRHGFVRDDVVIGNFLMGLGMLTRPLPERAVALFPDAASWALEVYLRGLCPD